jgi:hypothetical protein
VSFTAITFYVASKRVFIVVYFVVDSVRKLLDTPSCVLELSRRLNSIKFSRAISHVRCLYETDVTRTILVIIIRDLIAREDFISFNVFALR